MDPTIWGEPGWKFLHNITFAYPLNPTPEDKNWYKIFFVSAGRVLPCQVCRENYNGHLLQYPLNEEALSSRNNMINWLLNVHNAVSLSLNEGYITREEMISRYLLGEKPSFWKRVFPTVLVVLCFVFILMLFLNTKR